MSDAVASDVFGSAEVSPCSARLAVRGAGGAALARRALALLRAGICSGWVGDLDDLDVEVRPRPQHERCPCIAFPRRAIPQAD